MARLLITGTTGGIGGAIKIAALSRGFEVRELNRCDDFSVLPEGEFDALIFATGMNEVLPVTLLSDEKFAAMIEANVGLFLKAVRAFVKGKRYNPGGAKIIAISSVSAKEGWSGGAAYCASKGALSAMCRALNEELRPKKIEVIALEPEYVKTKMFFATAGRMGIKDALEPNVFAAQVLEKLK
ncbi:MAG: SDR family oxidoreductase [Kiritimatiellae bacterium]|nr:SDR family oxidoreductase [Kiritimatiellia bacterium]